jgi:LysR family transcriptional regulator, regulator for metE and metH
MFELKHLKTLHALAETGSVGKAAATLFISQSALSHQIKELERRIDATTFIRNSNPLQFTEQGRLLLTLAQQVLPQIKRCQQQLKLHKGEKIKLTIAMACHGCFQWLLPVIEQFNQQNPTYKIALMDEIFDQHHHSEIALLFTDVKKANDQQFVYQRLGRFEVVVVMPPNHPLATKAYLQPTDFISETLLTYPVSTTQLDIFSHFLTPHDIVPHVVKSVVNSHKMLQMVAANMGIAAVPAWLVNSLAMQSLLRCKKVGEQGLYKSLYVRYLQQGEFSSAIARLIPCAKQAFSQLN